MNFKRAPELVAVLTLVMASGCATGRRRVITTNCVADPSARAVHCYYPDGNYSMVGFDAIGNWVCRPPDQDQILNDAAHPR